MSKLNKLQTIYLCGGINALTDAECKDWRVYVTEQLKGKYETLDPMRRDYRGREPEPGIAEEIVNGDLQDIAQSDLVLVNATKPSWGTAMEIVYACTLHKPVLVFGASAPMSPWLQFHSALRFNDVMHAVQVLKGAA